MKIIQKHITIGLYIFITLSLPRTGYAQNRLRDLPPVIVEGKMPKPEKVIKILANRFREFYASAGIVSVAEEFRAVSANGNFIDLKAGLGYLYIPRYQTNPRKEENLPLFCFLDRYASNSYRPDGTQILAPETLQGKYPAGYSNRMGYIPECVVNLAVSYSPLNARYIKYYTYTAKSEDKAGRIYFRSVKNPVPSKCKIIAEGYIDYLPDSFTVERITFTRLESFLYGKKILSPYAHTDHAILSFGYGPDGLYIRSLYYTRQWKDTSAPSAKVQLMAQPVRRNPAKYKLKEYYLLTSVPPFIKEKQIFSVPDAKAAFYCFRYEYASCTAELWKKLKERDFNGFPFAQAWKQLNEKQSMDEQMRHLDGYIPSESDYNDLKRNYGSYFDNIFRNYRSFLNFYNQSKKLFSNELPFQK